MSEVILEIDLGQDKTFTTSKTRMEGKSKRELGRFLNRIDVNQELFLQNRPVNNVFSVRLMDNLTNSVSTENYEYVINLNLEKIN